jgi:hypothetical protein
MVGVELCGAKTARSKGRRNRRKAILTFSVGLEIQLRATARPGVLLPDVRITRDS